MILVPSGAQTAGYVAHGRTARSDRRVGLRPASDTMSVLSGLQPVEQDVSRSGISITSARAGRVGRPAWPTGVGCVRGNYVREMPGQRVELIRDGLGRQPHTVRTTTPTGHTYASRVGLSTTPESGTAPPRPAPPRPAAAAPPPPRRPAAPPPRRATARPPGRPATTPPRRATARPPAARPAARRAAAAAPPPRAAAPRRRPAPPPGRPAARPPGRHCQPSSPRPSALMWVPVRGRGGTP